MGVFISDIEGDRTKIIREGVFSYHFAKGIFGYIIWYIAAVVGFYIFILKRNGSVFEGALYGSILCTTTDFTMYTLFSRARNEHLLVMLYDIVVIGAFGFGITTFIWKNYQTFLSDNTFLLFVAALLTLSFGFYKLHAIETSPYVPPEKLKQAPETK